MFEGTRLKFLLNINRYVTEDTLLLEARFLSLLNKGSYQGLSTQQYH